MIPVRRPMETETRERLFRRAVFLEYLTIVWNVVEGAVSIAIGIRSGSLSLVAFGLESGIEVFSSSVAIWSLGGRGDGKRKYALRMIGAALVVVGVSVVFNAARGLAEGRRSEPGVAAVFAMFAITVVMLIVGVVKRGIGRRLGNGVIVAESGVTLLDSALSGSILVGLLLNLVFGWWWTDQVLALVIAGNALREGVKGLRSPVTEGPEGA